MNICDRVVVSQRNLHTKGGVSKAERCGTFINKTLWKQLMSCPSVQTEVESALFSRLRRTVKSLLQQKRGTTNFKHFSMCKESVRQQFSLKGKKKECTFFKSNLPIGIK